MGPKCIICHHHEFTHNVWPIPTYPALSCLEDGCDCQKFIARDELCVKCGKNTRVYLFQPNPDESSEEDYYCDSCVDGLL